MSNILRSRRVVARGRGMQSTVQSPGWAENEDFSDSSDECRPGAGVGRVSFRDVERDRYQLGPSIGNQRYLDDFQFHEDYNDDGEPSRRPFNGYSNLINITLPKFNSTDCMLWFAATENLFSLKRVFNEIDKYQLVIAALDINHMQKLRYVLAHMDERRPYKHLKQEMIRIFSPSNDKNIEQLFSVELADRKPSEMLDLMRHLIGSDYSPHLLRKLFLDRLPLNVRQAVVAGPDCGLSELAARADRVMELNAGSHKKAGIASSKSDTVLIEKVNDLAETVNKLLAVSNTSNSFNATISTRANSTDVMRRPSGSLNPHLCSTPAASTFNDFRGRGRLNAYGAGKSNFPKPFNMPPRTNNFFSGNRQFDSGLCHLHARYGRDARRCIPPCNWDRHNSFSSDNTSRLSKFEAPSGIASGVYDYIGNHPGMVTVKDPKTFVRFLIDSGSSHSYLPTWRDASCAGLTGMLSAANGEGVPVFEEVKLVVNLNMNRDFEWTFRRAGVKCAIIGLDFLRHYNLTVDPRNSKLISLDDFGQNRSREVNLPRGSEIDVGSGQVDSSSMRECDFESSFAPCATSVESVEELFERYAEVFNVDNFLKPSKLNVKHYIKTRGPPVSAKVRRLSPEKLEALRKELEHFLDLGIIARASSDWASPVHLVEKKEPGTYRITGDFRMLNQQTVPDSYSLPILTDFVDNMAGCTFFTSLDLYKSYHQIEVAESDVDKTAIITPLGTYVFKRMPMGLRCASQSFQRLVDRLFSKQSDFVFKYVDDLLIFSKTKEEHLSHLTQVFEILNHAGLILNKEKCVFCVPEINFLGHTVGANGIRPLDAKIDAIQSFPRPKNMKQLRRFLGMINFYRRFLKNAAATLDPLNKMLSPFKSSKRLLVWDRQSEAAFENAKTQLAELSLLSYPIHGAPTILSTDASGVAVGGNLSQIQDGKTVPIAFFSKSLSEAQRRFSTFDRELLAMYLAVRHFQYFLEGRRFIIQTDHKPLMHAFVSPMKNATAKQLRYLSYISEFSTDVKYIAGEENVVADCMSRSVDIAALFEDCSPLNFQALSQSQESSRMVQNLISSRSHSLNLTKVRVGDSDNMLVGDVSTGQFRPLVTFEFRRQVFDIVHGLSHPGIRASQKLIAERFVWPGMKQDIKIFVQSCILCQQSKIQRHNVAPLQSFELPKERFSHVHCDIVGKLVNSDGYSYLLTVIDRFTRHVEAIPLVEVTAKSTAQAFLLHWVSRFGAPVTLTTDQGVQFTSNLWAEMCQFLGTELRQVSVRHPQAQGMNERVHRTLKAALRATPNPTEWHSNLPFVLMGMRAMLKEDIGCSSSELTLGTCLRLPGQFFDHVESSITQSDFRRQLVSFMGGLRATAPRFPCNRSSYLEEKLKTCTHVFVRNDAPKHSLERAYLGPFRVLDKFDKYFSVDLNTRIENVSVDRLKAATVLMDVDDSCSDLVELDANYDPTADADFLLVSGHVEDGEASDSITEEVLQNFDNLPQVTRTRRGRVVVPPIRFRRSLSG